jgi:NAD(P)-dependent dehydrogenase (short-subunit alcohol dehydrogenase family)
VDLDLNGKVAVVTGAGKGIGLAVTMALAGEGAHVVAGSRSTGSLDGLKGVTPVAIDLSAAEGPAQLIQRAIEEHGQVDVLVNNVGAVRMRTEGFLGTSDEDFAWAMQMNFFIALRASRAALTAMAARRAGAIVKRRLGQCLLPARRGHDRLRCRESRAGQPHQDPRAGVRPARDQG